MSGEFAPKLVRLLFELREDSRCFYCGRFLAWEQRGGAFGWHAHHRKPRGAGVEIGKASNCLIVCATCHRWVHANPALSLEYGLIVTRNGVDLPVNVPARREDGSEWFLSNHGSAIDVGEGVTF